MNDNMSVEDVHQAIWAAQDADRDGVGYVDTVGANGAWMVERVRNTLYRREVTWVDGVAKLGDPVRVRREVHFIPTSGDQASTVAVPDSQAMAAYDIDEADRLLDKLEVRAPWEEGDGQRVKVVLSGVPGRGFDVVKDYEVIYDMAQLFERAEFSPCEPCKTPRMCGKAGACAKADK